MQTLAVFDDGQGPALYAGGPFTTAGGIEASYIAKWDGSSWSTLGSGMDGEVLALMVYDDGSGPALYAGGDFTTAGGVMASGIARWNGSSWAALGTGMGGGYARAESLEVFDDGSGPALYAGGDFTTAGGVSALRIAKWNGSSWAALGSGLTGGVNPVVYSLTVYDDGGGPALYAGGGFTKAGGLAASGIAKWDGTSWSALGSGVSNWTNQHEIDSLIVHDDGSGEALYVGGWFTIAGGVTANGIARWDGSSWSALGSGMSGGGLYMSVFALSVFDDGSGPILYAGGTFTIAGGVQASCIARWDGARWTAVGDGVGPFPQISSVSALMVYDDGSGPALHVSGGFMTAGNVAVSNFAKWDGASWMALGNGMNGSVQALARFDDGSGPALFAGGAFLTAGGVAVTRIAKWDGAGWSALGSGMSGDYSPSVHALLVFDDGSGPTLHAGGIFTTAGGVQASSIARWDGMTWTALGSGLTGDVRALAVYDDGSGPALYAGGDFTSAGGMSVRRIARWDGFSWSSIGGPPGTSATVNALAVYDDGSGPALYVGGYFVQVSGVPANYVARWNGASWSALSSGMNATVLALTVHDDGSGPALYAGGAFTTASGVAANGIAKWDGISWSPLDSGMNDDVSALTSFDDGSGPALFAGGSFTTAGGVAAGGIAKWDGTSWSTLSSGVGGASDTVLALLAFDDGSGPDVYAGGSFGRASDCHDSFLARWGCPLVTTPGKARRR